MNFKEYIKKVINDGTLPGFEAQKQMAPSTTRDKIRSFIPESGYKEASVLILLNEKLNTETSNSIAKNLEYQILLTERSTKLNSHSGQLSFPGGRVEQSESALDAAIRETHEEIGITHEHYEILGELSKLYVPPSNSLITPFIAVCHQKLSYSLDENLKLNKDEVESAFWVDLNYLSHPNNLQFKTTNLMNKETIVPYWDVSKFSNTEVPLWGATAIMLKELIHIYEDYLKQY